MGKKSLIFPGQGSQTVGMGKALYDAFPEARDVFNEVDDALNQKLSKIIFEGPIEDLTLTENTQPALMATSMAAIKVLTKQSRKSVDFFADFVAGHSLGEYSALCAAGAFSIGQTAKLLKIRGQAMQDAVPAGKGAMAAVIGLSFEQVEELCKRASTSAEPCEIANDNSDGQIVVSGSMAGIDTAEPIAKELGAKRFLKLQVSAPFHSSLMQKAKEEMEKALAETKIEKPVVPVIANVTAKTTFNPDEIRKLLVEQVTGRVRWRESILFMSGDLGVSNFVEVGAGKVLSGLVKRIAENPVCYNIETPEDIEKYLAAIGI